MNQRKTPPCPAGLRSGNRPAARQAATIACGPDLGTVWEVHSPSGEILRVVVVEYYKAGEEAPFAFSRCIAITRFVGTTGPRDTFVELEPAEELAVAHCWLEGPIREVLLKRCVATVSAESLASIEENRKPLAAPDLPNQVAAFRKSLRQQMNAVFRDSWRELYEQLDEDGAVDACAGLGRRSGQTNKRSDSGPVADESFALAASGSTQSLGELRTFKIDGNPATLVDVTESADRVLTFLLRRALPKASSSDPPVVYDRVVVVDDNGNHFSGSLSALPTTIKLPSDSGELSFFLVSRDDGEEHALLKMEA